MYFLIYYKDIKNVAEFIDEFLSNIRPIGLSRDAYSYLISEVETLILGNVEY